MEQNRIRSISEWIGQSKNFHFDRQFQNLIFHYMYIVFSYIMLL